MRVTPAKLAIYVDEINQALGREVISYQAGSYVLDKDLGGWRLEEVIESGGHAARSPRLPAANMALFLAAFFQGVTAMKNNKV